METRPLGATGHHSSILTFGAIALDYLPQDEATAMVSDAVDRGVNHIDVAPSYGEAELRLAPFLSDRRDEVFLGCKTKDRTREGAREMMERSMDRLGVSHFDLYQFHAVTRVEEIDQITETDGALEAVQAAKEEGIVDHIGVTSHGAAPVIKEAIRRIEPDTVMFPMNAIVAGREDPENDYDDLVSFASDREVGCLGIKAFAKQPWSGGFEDMPREDRPHPTWYEPFSDPDELEACLRFALSRGMTSITNAGDPTLVPPILDAAERFEPLSPDE
ncbi:MAG: aldo/keto reductase, partial [Halobacteriales archaeon]|nr:aldo/keto reductase [Halobacteriales archaeon]